MPYTNTSRQIRLPNLFNACPLKAATNPYYKEAAAESRAWISKYGLFNDRKRAFFFQAESELLCSYAYPFAGYEQFRTTCDFASGSSSRNCMVRLITDALRLISSFFFDGASDEKSGVGAREINQVFVNAMKNSGWDDGSILAQITREPRTVQRWSRLCEMYTECVATEAKLRQRGEFLNLETFIPIRRYNSGVPLCLSIVEYLLGTDLEDEVYEDPNFSAAYWAACDHVCWENDLYSYDLEQSRGQTGNNVVPLLAKEKNLTLQESADLVGAKCNEFVRIYLDVKSKLSPALGSNAAQFVEAIGCCIIGNLMWSFESPRYFGSQLHQVKENGVMTLRHRELPEYDYFESSDEE